MYLAERCGTAPGSLLAGSGYVDTIFGRAVNIRMSDGMCLSIVDSTLDMAPNRIIMPPDVLRKICFQPGDSVWVGGNVLYHNGTRIKFTPSAPADLTVITPSDSSVLQIKSVLSLGRGACRVFLGLEAGGLFEQKIVGLTRILAAGIQSGIDLIGLGPGYTPAGDDVLTGYCALARRLGLLDLEWHFSLVKKAFAESTILSATALYFAGRGQVQELLDNVLLALNNPQQLAFACLILINEVGTTSGSDMLLGVLAACLCMLTRENCVD